MTALKWLWTHRLEWMVVAQLAIANLVTADLVSGTPMKWVLYVNACLTGTIAFLNKLKEVRDSRAQETSP